MAKPTCTIRFDGSRYYLGFGACRSRQDYSTFAFAVRYAKSMGNEVETIVDPAIEYRANDSKTKIVTNLVSGKLCRIPVNTPSYCDPSTEQYWSM